MQKHHEIALKAADEWLDNVDSSEFLKKFIELQKKSTGPTVNEFIESMHIPTHAIFGLTDFDWSDPFTDVESLILSKHDSEYLQAKFKEKFSLDNCANDKFYKLDEQKRINTNNSFSLDDDYSEAA